jgi:hypothetical protein
VRSTLSSPAGRSTSRRSSACHSSGRRPVAAANAGSGAYIGDSSTPIASTSARVNARTGRGAGWRLGPASFAGLALMWPHRHAASSVLVSIRKAMTTIQASGYNPDTLVLTPANAETLDTLVSGITGADNDYVFGGGRFAPGQLFGLNVRISKSVPAPVVVDSTAFGKLYSSPITLARFEQDAGATNQSTVRLEGCRLRDRAAGCGGQDRGVVMAARKKASKKTRAPKRTRKKKEDEPVVPSLTAITRRGRGGRRARR